MRAQTAPKHPRFFWQKKQDGPKRAFQQEQGGPFSVFKKPSVLFSSVYVRMVLIYVMVITATVMVLGFALGNSSANQYRDELTDNLLRQCERINELLPDWLYGDDERKRDAIQELTFISRQAYAVIWVFEKDGGKRSIADSTSTYWRVYSSEVDMDTEYVQAVLAGKQIRGYNLFRDEIREPVMSIGSPWTEDGEIMGAIFIHARTYDMDAKTMDMIYNSIIACCIAIMVSLVLVSFIAHRFTQPLVVMNRVVQSYATGNFEERVPPSGHDEIGQLAGSINEMAVDLQSLEDLRRSFVANVSHELKGPLASMRGFLQAIIEKAIPEETVPETLDIVMEETVRLNELINDLLDLSRMESGGFSLNKKVFNMQELMLRTLITFEVRIEERNMDVDVQFDEIPCMVCADRDRIEQVVRNFIDNSIKYAGQGAVLKLRCHRRGNSAIIEIGDNGAGIAPEDLPHIWDRFYKADKAHTRGTEGTGLGLSIVKQILDQHEGHPAVSSELGKGTVFRFELPIVKNSVGRGLPDDEAPKDSEAL